MNKDYEQRVVNLIKKADSVAGTPEEQAFRAKALELIAKYNLSEASLRDKSQGKLAITDRVKSFVKQHHMTSQVLLYSVIAKAQGCHCIQTANGVIRVFGTEQALDQVDWVYGLIWPSALSQTLAQRPPGNPSRGDVTIHRKSFLYGFVISIKERLDEAAPKGEDERSEGALVLLDDAKRAEEEMRKAYPNARRANSSRTIHEGAAEQGMAAGRNVNMGQTGVRGGRRAIGA